MHTSAGNIAATLGALGGNLVDLIHIDDPILGEFHIPVRLFDQIPNEVVHIMPNISGFGKFGGIGFDKRNPNQFGHIAHQVSLPHAGWAKKKDIGLEILRGFRLGIIETAADMVVVITNRHRKHTLGLLLLDYETVEVVPNLLGFAVKATDGIEGVPFGRHRIFGRFFILFIPLFLRIGRLVHGLHEGSKCDLNIFIFEQITQLFLDFLHGVFVVFLGHDL